MTHAPTATPTSPTLHHTAIVDQSAPVEQLSYVEQCFVEKHYVGVTNDGALRIIQALRSVPCPYNTSWCEEGGLPHDVCRKWRTFRAPGSDGPRDTFDASIETDDVGVPHLVISSDGRDCVNVSPAEMRKLAEGLVAHTLHLIELADEFEALSGGAE